MYWGRLVCSDPACAAEVAAETATLRELDTLICECGCSLELIGWPEVSADALAQVILLRAGAARRGRDVPEAA